MNILAFAASNSKQSINKGLVEYAAQTLGNTKPSAAIDIIDLNDFEMPIYSTDRELDTGIPDAATQFLGKIQAADVIIVSFAEHNGSYTAAYKNIFDWVSRIDAKVYNDKKIVAFSASPGGMGGASVLAAFAASAQFFGGTILSTLSVGSFYDRFDAEKGQPIDEALAEQIVETLRPIADL
ncbi:NADPH-dependent FMN reductase [Hyphococcus sp. DH-69]|uniref:NADPH-dependent FMN reductase n=1 Tax=Hyphococcus formosus TaxID=3143534 RepID=UPI00398AA1AA